MPFKIKGDFMSPFVFSGECVFRNSKRWVTYWLKDIGNSKYFSICNQCFSPSWRVTFCQQRQKVTKKRRPKKVCPAGARVIDLCLRAVLIRLPWLNKTKSNVVFDLPYQRSITRQTLKGIELSLRGCVLR